MFRVYCFGVVFMSKFLLLSDKFTAAKPVRKRRWGSTSVLQRPILSVNISTDSLKVSLPIVYILFTGSHVLYAFPMT